MDELARYLTRNGHEVITVSTKPGRHVVETSDVGTRILHKSMWTPALARTRIQDTHMFLASSLRSVLSLKPDVVHSFSFTDSLGASLTKTWRRHATVVGLAGVPVPTAYYRRFPPDRWIIREALERADSRIACSEFVRRLLTHYYGVDAEVVPPPVNVDHFTCGTVPRRDPPSVLSVADFDVRRKGIRVLMQAFLLVKRQVPSVRIRLFGRLSPNVRAETVDTLPAWARADVDVLGVGNAEDLPRLYQESSITVLPSMWEPAGLVILESLASGTPVVATNHSGLPEFVTDDVGVLFEPETDGEETHNAEGLAQAMLEGLTLAQKSETRDACRAHATRFSWTVLGPQLEQLYRATSRVQ